MARERHDQPPLRDPLLPSTSHSSVFNGNTILPVYAIGGGGGGVLSMIRIDTFGRHEEVELNKLEVMRRCGLSPRDVRLLDPVFTYPPTILCRENAAIILNLESVRCTIGEDEVLFLNSLVVGTVPNFVQVMHSRLRGDLMHRTSMFSTDDLAGMGLSMNAGWSAANHLPFKFKALEVALEVACNDLNHQANILEREAYPTIEELTSKVNQSNLEKMRRIKGRLLELEPKVQKVKDEIEKLMDDERNMARIFRSERPRVNEVISSPEFSNNSHHDEGINLPASAPPSLASSPARDTHWLQETSDTDHESLVQNNHRNVNELQILLEPYLVIIDSTLNKLKTLREYISETEDFLGMQLDNVRNQLIKFDLLLTTASFVVTILGLTAAFFGMNFYLSIYTDKTAFMLVVLIAGAFGVALFCAFLLYFRCARLMPT